MSKQTSVDFLIEKYSAILERVNFTVMQHLLLKDAVEEAREMHEIEIIEAFKHGELPPLFVNYNAEEYYNETYKKEEK
jgi:hypothetical protein